MSIRAGTTGNDLRLSTLRRESRPKSGLVASGIAGNTGLLRIFAVSPVGSLCNRLDIRLGMFLVLVDSPVKDAAIRSAAKPRGTSGAYLLRTITHQLQKLRAQGLSVEIRWVPAHRGSTATRQPTERRKKPRDGGKGVHQDQRHRSPLSCTP
jgi:hypothetical protein